MKIKLLIIFLLLVNFQIFAEKKDIDKKEYYQSGYKNDGNGWSNYYQQDYKKVRKSLKKEKNKISGNKKDK